jgi:hypothetical protein
MSWIFDPESQTFLAEVDRIRGRVWYAPARTWSARVITPRKEFWRHDFLTSAAAKAWCEAQVATCLDGAHRTAGASSAAGSRR